MKEIPPKDCRLLKEDLTDAFGGFGIGLSRTLASVILKNPGIAKELLGRELKPKCSGCPHSEECQEEKSKKQYHPRSASNGRCKLC